MRVTFQVQLAYLSGGRLGGFGLRGQPFQRYADNVPERGQDPAGLLSVLIHISGGGAWVN